MSPLGILDQGYLVLFLFFFSGKFLPTLRNSAEMTPILWRLSPTIQMELCSPMCWPTHTPRDSRPDLTEPHRTLACSLKQRPPPWPDQCLSLSNILTKEDHGDSVQASLWVTLQQVHTLLLPAVELTLSRISFTCSQTSLYQLYLLPSIFNLISSTVMKCR